jgi:uncharacterized membrane protein YdbT with pleckstrin-like domain
MPLSTTEDTLWRGSPSWLLILGRIIWIALTIIVLTSVAYFLRSASPDVERGATMFRVVLIIMGIVVMWQGVFALIAYARIATTIYKLTNQRLTIESGITDKSIEDIDLRYVEDSQFRQKLMERLLGIGNITLVSSDKTAPSYVLRGVQNPRELRELIRSTAYQISQRQLFTRST